MSRGGRGISFGLGFNLIGLLVVVAILGVSSAIAFSAFGGGTTGIAAGRTVGGATPTTTYTATATTGIIAIPQETAIAACESDATDVQTAVQEYGIEHGSAVAVTPADLTSGPSPYLEAFPSSPDFAISIVSGVVMVAAPRTAAPVAFSTPDACAKAGA